MTEALGCGRTAGLPSAGDAAPGHQAREHHDRQDRNGEDHRFRIDQGEGGWSRQHHPTDHDEILGIAQYTAPEYFLGESGSLRNRAQSIAVLAGAVISSAAGYSRAAVPALWRPRLEQAGADRIGEP